MDVAVNPEPSPQELQALRAALERLDERERGAASGYESVWRFAGLLENVDSAPEVGLSGTVAGAPPRSSDGASLA